MFDEADVSTFMTSDALVSRYFTHVAAAGAADQVKNASNMVVESFKWRKENKIRCEGNMLIAGRVIAYQ